MDDPRTDRTGGGVLTLKRVASWMLVAASATAFAAYWHVLIFHSSNPDAPVFWVYSAFVALVIGFAYMLISLLETVARQKWQFGLRDVIAVVTIVAVVLGAIAYGIRK